MTLHLPTADIFIPDGKPAADALSRTTHLGIGAHQDDLEFMAFHGILQCFHSETEWFGGVTCTNGSGSARTGSYADFTDAEMMAVRREEQRQAAIVGRFGAMVQLDYPSGTAKDPADPRLREDLRAILAAAQRDLALPAHVDEIATLDGIVEILFDVLLLQIVHRQILFLI